MYSIKQTIFAGIFSGKNCYNHCSQTINRKNADNIVVLKNGEIVEQGTHGLLVSNKGEYFNLVKNQLELGS
jgi:ATP-binding cassette subfamily B protein